jgi:thiamine biosynthesis lipoprotein
MGTHYHITLVTELALSQEQQSSLQWLIDKRLQRINQLMSTYIPDSEISKFNRYDAETMMGFPSDQAIQVAKQQVGWKSLVIDPQKQRIKKNKPLTINLSAVAKGYAVDQIALLLEEQRIENYMVEIGGEIRVNGYNSTQQAWRIGVESPSFLPSKVQEVIQLNNQAVATSGDYRNFFERDGVRYSHTIDPETGKPVVHNIASLTVIADSAMVADGLATAMMVMGEDQALAMASEYTIPIYIILYENDTFRAVHSPSFLAYFH